MLKIVKSVSVLTLLSISALVASGGVVYAQTAAPDSALKEGKPAATSKTAAPKAATKTAASKTAGKAPASATAPAPATATATKTAAAGAPVRPAPAPGHAAAGADKDSPLTPPPANSSPMAELKKSNDQLDKLLKKKYPNWSPEAEAQKAAVQKLVGGFLDYRELARRSLAKHWDKLTPAQRQDFVTTLRELVERSYLKQISGDPNYSIKYDKEEKDGSEATVDATLNTVARNKKVKISLNYKLVYKDRWLVYDVVTDEQSMLENYRAEFNKIINKDGFETLLKRMKKKLEEKDE